MAPKIVVACGSGVVTSQTVASKLTRLLERRGIEADVEAVDIKELKQALRDADAYVSVVKTDGDYGVPVFNGVTFLTGMGQDQEFERLVEAIEHK